MKVLDNGLVRVKWEVNNNTQPLVAPSDFQIDRAPNWPPPESYVQEQTVTKRRKTRKSPVLNIRNSDATDALSNSNKQAGAVFIFPPDGNSSDEDSADKEEPQLDNLSQRQLLSQCELQVATIETKQTVVIDQLEKLGIMSSSDNMSLLP